MKRSLAARHSELTAYDTIDPANRLVADELERRWNEALKGRAFGVCRAEGATGGIRALARIGAPAIEMPAERAPRKILYALVRAAPKRILLIWAVSH